MKYFTLLLVIFLSAACGNRDPKVVVDPGPRVNVTSNNIKINGTSELISRNVSRLDPSSGPDVFVSFDDFQNLRSIEKVLNCGTYSITGKDYPVSDPRSRYFRISENEFKGLNLLPIQLDCKLVLTFKNEKSSVLQISKNVRLTFDGLPTLPIIHKSPISGLQQIIYGNRVVLHRFSISESFPFSMHLAVKVPATSTAAGCYRIKKSLPRPMDFCKDIWVQISQEMTSEGLDVVAKSDEKIEFKTSPGKKGEIVIFGYLPENILDASKVTPGYMGPRADNMIGVVLRPAGITLEIVFNTIGLDKQPIPPSPALTVVQPDLGIAPAPPLM